MNWPKREALARRGADPAAIVLAYHRVAELEHDPWGLNVTPRHFAEHLEVLRSLGTARRLQTVIPTLRNGGLRPLSVAVTFDDGYADNLYGAKPLLECYDIPATVFVIAGMIGARHGFWWDELGFLLQPGVLPVRLSLEIGNTHFEWELGTSACLAEHEAQRHAAWRTWQAPPSSRHALYLALWERLQPLSDNERRRVLDELRAWAGGGQAGCSAERSLSHAEIPALTEGGLIEVGAHTMTHPVLARLSPAAQREEIVRSKRTLENLLGRPVTSFSYPFGGRQDYTPVTATIVREAGFFSACANFAGIVTRSTDRFQMPRRYVPDVDGDGFERLLDECLGGPCS